MPKHEWKGTKLRFQLTPSKWGKWVDLQGPAGKAGTAGGVYVGGGSAGPAWNPDTLPAANDDLPEQFIVKQGDAWVRASYAQMQTWFPGGQGSGQFDVDGGHADTVYEGTLKIDFGGAA